jgi:MHS family citrate/tricarballylate:H+ symporter-like MFS transporter
MDIAVEDTPALASNHPFAPKQRRQAIFAATLGNALEFYDFVTFAFFAIQIGHTFFPSESAFLSLMGSLAIFWAGFLTRPLGALVLGTYADRVGRKPAMMISMTMMGAGIALLVLTPSYARIGYAAPVIAVVARMIQGFALGGEVGSATIYMMEDAEPRRRAFAMSWQGASQYISGSAGSLVGLVLSLTMSDAELSSYGWRIALGLGVTIVPLALWVRKSLPETIHHADTAVVANAGLRSYSRPIVCGLIMIGAATIATYILQYMATYGQHTLHLSTTLSLAGLLANNAISVVAVLLGASISDRVGRKRVMLMAQPLYCAVIVPCFLLMTTQRDAMGFIGANLILAFAQTFLSGVVYATIGESIPKEVRARAFALIYALPVAILGGSTQLVVTWLLKLTGSPMSLGWYLTAIALIGLAAMYALKESAPVKLDGALRSDAIGGLSKA